MIGVQYDPIDRATGGDRRRRVADLMEKDYENFERVYGRSIPQVPNGAEVGSEPDQERDLSYGVCCLSFFYGRSGASVSVPPAPPNVIG